MAELDYISIEGFRSISAQQKLQIRRINVVVGANGSGKSNLIGVFGFLNAIRRGDLQKYVGTAGGAANILHFGPKITKRIRIHLSFEQGKHGYEIDLVPTADDRLAVADETALFWNEERFPEGGSYREVLTRGAAPEAGISKTDLRKVPNYVQRRLDSWRVYHFHDTGPASPLKQTADINDNGFLRLDGQNLAAFLYYLQQREASAFQQIEKTIRLIAPFFDRFELQPLKLNESKIRLQWRHRSSDQYFDASSLSDGTLRFIALATLFLQPQQFRPSVVLVDEPELGLHPYAITVLASLIKSASIQTQVIVSTQSPQLLDNFEPEDVLVANRVKEKTEFSRLDAAALEVWLEDFSLGQLWEKNEFGGRPGSLPDPGPILDAALG
jgi:predicted ATPase